MENAKFEIDYKSIIGMCLCRPGMRITHTVVHNSISQKTISIAARAGIRIDQVEPREDVTIYGDTSTHCKWCGKKWTDHKGLEDHK